MYVHYVYDFEVDTNDPILRKVMEFCEFHNINLTIREFDPRNREEDQEFITKLPAIQIYNKRNGYEDTLYLDSKPIHFLKLKFDKFELEELERQAKQDIWEERIKSIKRIFKKLKTDSLTSKSNV